MSFLDKARPVTQSTSTQPSFLSKARPVSVAPPVQAEPSTGRQVAETIAPSTTSLSDYVRASTRLKSGEIGYMQKEREELLKMNTPQAQQRIAEIDRDIADVTSKADKTFGQKVGMALGTGLEIGSLPELAVLGGVGGTYLAGKTAFGRAAIDKVAPTVAKPVLTPFAGNKTVQAINKATMLPTRTAAEETAYRAAPLTAKAGMIAKDTARIMPEALSMGYGYDVATGLQEGEGAKAFQPGAITAISAALPVAIGGARLAKNAVTPSKEKAISSLENTYSDLMSGTTPGKKKISKIEQKTDMMNKAGTQGKTPMRTLAEQGIIPERKGTKLSTYDQAVQYRSNIQPLKEANNAALAEIPTQVSLDDLEREAITHARSQKNIDAGRAPAMENEIKKQFAILRAENPTGAIPLTRADEIKSARWDNVFGNKSLVESDKLLKDSEYSIAKAFQKKIEDVAEASGHADVAQLNREIGDRLDASRFLEDLDGKTIKGGRLLKYISTGIGSSMGNTFTGKLLGALGGNIVGELIIAANVSGPIKRLILRNLETKDPAAYTKTIEWLRKQKLDKETRLLLPPPKNIIPMGGRNYLNQQVDASGKLIQSKSPTSQQTIKAINNVSNIDTPSISPKPELTGVDKEAFDSMDYYFSETDGPQFIRYFDNADKDYKTYRTSTSMADFPDNLKSRALFDRVKPYWDRQEVPKSPLMKELYEELQQRMKLVKEKIERSNNASEVNKDTSGAAFAGVPAGIGQDEEGNTTFDPKMMALGMIGGQIVGKKQTRDAVGKFANKFILKQPVTKTEQKAISILNNDLNSGTKQLKDIWEDNKEAFDYLQKVRAFSTEGGLKGSDLKRIKKALEDVDQANKKALIKKQLDDNDSAAADILNRLPRNNK